MKEDGSYIRASDSRKTPGFSSQEFLMRLAEGKVELSAIPNAGAIVETPVTKIAFAAETPVPEKKTVAAQK